MQTQKSAVFRNVAITASIGFLAFLIVIGVASLITSFAEMKQNVVLSAFVLVWFSLLWSQISALGDRFIFIRRVGCTLTIAGTLLSLVLVWTDTTAVAEMVLLPVLYYYLLSYACGHYAFFLNARPHPTNLLRHIEATAIASISLFVLLGGVFVLADGQIESRFYYILLVATVTYNFLLTVLFSIIRRRTVVYTCT